MTSGLRVSGCATCGWRGFPARLWCPACGSDELRDVVVHVGRVEEVTLLRRAPGGLQHPVRIGSVRIAGGVVVIARLDSAAAGARVRLHTDRGAPVARPL